MSQTTVIAPPQPGWHAPESITVASVPSGHVYVRHLLDPDPCVDSGATTYLADPRPDRSRSAPTVSPWWPPAMLNPQWIRDHDEFDVMHLQFGFDALAPAELVDVVDAVHDTGRALVYTVHDLRNPHHLGREEHDASLDVLVPSADVVVTLTQGAAAEIHRRWGRRAVVLPHPHVVDLEILAERERQSLISVAEPDAPFVVGLHAKSLRAGMDPATILPALCEAVDRIPGGRLQINGHPDVLRPGGDRFDPRLARALVAAAAALGERLDLRVHDYFDDAQLWTYLSDLDVSVLPYRFGTHSGWLEACRDLGTAIVAPTCGYYADQGPVHSYAMDEYSFNHGSLVDAIDRAYAAGPTVPVSVAQRTAQRRMLAQAHTDLYLRAIDAVGQRVGVGRGGRACASV